MLYDAGAVPVGRMNVTVPYDAGAVPGGAAVSLPYPWGSVVFKYGAPRELPGESGVPIGRGIMPLGSPALVEGVGWLAAVPVGQGDAAARAAMPPRRMVKDGIVGRAGGGQLSVCAVGGREDGACQKLGADG